MTAPNTAIQLQQAMPVSMGFTSMESFEFLQRAAKAFVSSTMVPTAYQALVTKGYGDKATVEPNPAAMSNCMIALDMAVRMNANPLMIMQNLHIIEGRPSWSSPFIIAMVNQCGRFTPLQFELRWLDEIDATHTTYEWENRQKVARTNVVRLRNARCVAWVLERGTALPSFTPDELKKHGGLYACCKAHGVQILESAPITMEMAVNEGWYTKNGSKWKTMPEQMLRYRSAAFFGRIYAPELLMGLPSDDELRDVFVQDAAGNTVHAGQQGVPPSTGTLDPSSGEPTPDPPTYPDAEFSKGLPGWVKLIITGKKTLPGLLATLESKHPLTEAQRQQLEKAVAAAAPQDATPRDPNAPEVTRLQVEQRLRDATSVDELNEAANLIDALSPEDQVACNATYDARMGELGEQP